MNTLGGIEVIETGSSPEDILHDGEGGFYTTLGNGDILRISPEGEHSVLVNTGGRPLGIEKLNENQLLVCDSEKGLLLVEKSNGAISPLVRAGENKLALCNNAGVARDGSIYFSDSSQLHVVKENEIDIIEAIPTGRLLRRRIDGNVEVLLNGLLFANGVVVSPDNTFVLVAETGKRRIHKVHISKNNFGQHEIFLDDLPGMPDNLSLGSDGLLWVAYPIKKNRLLHFVHSLPLPIRRFVGRIKDLPVLLPPPHFHVSAFDFEGNLVHDFDEIPNEYKSVTGVREFQGTLAFSSFFGNSIAFCKLLKTT